MNSNLSQPPSPSPTETSAVVRRDRALRLRTRVLLSTVTTAVLAVGGLGVLAEHSYAGRTTNASSTTTSSASTSAPSASGGSTTIVSGGS